MIKRVVGWACIAIAAGLIGVLAWVLVTGQEASSTKSYIMPAVGAFLFLIYGIRILRKKRPEA